MMNKNTEFPDLSNEYAEATINSPLKLDGKVVLFDKKVTLMPVELKKKPENERARKYR